jgi:hypothetical protein
MKGNLKKRGQNPVWMLHESNENEVGEQNRVNKGWQEKKEGRHHHGSGT